MTFVFKGLSELRKNFDVTVGIILRREGKGKIEDLTNPRRYELQFLTSLLLKLEEQVRQKPHKKALDEAARVFYGAMYVIIEDIENNRGMMDSPGLLNDRLQDAIGIGDGVKSEDKPDLFQIAKAYSLLNAFINQVFVEDDSRKGFRKEHMLMTVPTDHLHQLIKTSYRLEQEAQKEIIKSLEANGKTTVNVNDYKDFKKSPASAIDRFSGPAAEKEKLSGLAKLNADFDSLIIQELADKNQSKIEKLSLHRAAQLHFLNAIRESFKSARIDEGEKIAILAGAMHLVRQQIIDEYASSYHLSTLDRSIVYTGLTSLLAATEVSPQDTEALITSAVQYVRFMTIEPEGSEKKAFRERTIFSEIPGFDLKTVFNLFFDMIHGCRIEALKHVIDEFKKEGKAVEKTPASYFGFALGALSLFGKKAADSSDDEDDLKQVEHKPVATSANP